MSLILTAQGCHCWVATASAAGPILALDGQRLEDPRQSRGGGAARATPHTADAAAEDSGAETSAAVRPAATGDAGPWRSEANTKRSRSAGSTIVSTTTEPKGLPSGPCGNGGET